MEAVAPARATGRTIVLPVVRVAGGAVEHGGALRLRAGRRSVTLRELRATARPLRLSARIGPGPRRALLATAPGASALSRRLRRPVEPGRLGTIAVDAPGAARVVGGRLDWGYAAALRTTFQGVFAPALTGGAEQTADGTFLLPITGGRYDAATRSAALTSSGGFRVGYLLRPADAAGAHGIWVTLWNVSVRLDGDTGTIDAPSDSGFHGSPPLAPAVRRIATLDLAGVTPQVGADGRTLTWPAVPATIAPGGAELVAGFVDAPGHPSLGDVRAIDPMTIVAELG